GQVGRSGAAVAVAATMRTMGLSGLIRLGLRGPSVKPRGASGVSVLLAVPLIVSLAGPAGAASSATAASTVLCASSSHPAPPRRISRAVTSADETRLLWL